MSRALSEKSLCVDGALDAKWSPFGLAPFRHMALIGKSLESNSFQSTNERFLFINQKFH